MTTTYTIKHEATKSVICKCGKLSDAMELAAFLSLRDGERFAVVSRHGNTIRTYLNGKAVMMPYIFTGLSRAHI